MNPFDNLVLDEPPLRTTADNLLNEGRRRLRLRRVATTLVTGTALAGVTVAGLSLSQPAPSAPKPATLAAPGPTPRSAPPGGKLTVDNLRAAFESGLGQRLDGAKARTDSSGKTEFELIGSYKGKAVVVTLGRRPGTALPSCSTDLGYTHGVPCRTEVTASGSVMFVASLSTVGNHIEHLISLVRKDGTFTSAGCSNVSYSDTGAATGAPSLTLDELRAAVLAIDARYEPAQPTAQ